MQRLNQQSRTMRAFLVAATLMFVAGCSSQSNNVPTSPQANIYLQVDRVGRPGVKELFETFADHSSSNRAIPSNDPVLRQDITSFLAAAEQMSTTAVSPLALDELALNPSSSAPAQYLGLETGSSTFGGRALTDDAMSADLNAAYGNEFAGETVTQPCMVSDNLHPSAALTASASGAFPYLANPQ